MIRCRVHNATNESVAVGVGKSVVNSPLLKCAVNGNDPNVGSECVVVVFKKKLNEIVFLLLLNIFCVCSFFLFTPFHSL